MCRDFVCLGKGGHDNIAASILFNVSKSRRDCGSTDLAVSCHQESTQRPFQHGTLAAFNMLLGLNLVQTHAVSAEDRYLWVWS